MMTWMIYEYLPLLLEAIRIRIYNQARKTGVTRLINEITRSKTAMSYQLLKYNVLALKIDRQWEGRIIEMYEGSEVLAEWKYFSDELSVEESTNRIADIVMLLLESEFGRPRDLITLDCLGYIQKSGNPGSIGLLYVLPLMLFQQIPNGLFRLLADKEAGCIAWPAIEERKNLACLLARAIFQLHVVGWLHKGTRSQNVIFLGKGGSLRSPYLIGFDYSRRGDESEKSEQTDLHLDLYRNPHAQGEAWSRLKFHASFDLFALRLVLPEISLWESLESIREKYREELNVSKIVAQDHLHTTLLEGKGPLQRIGFYMGTKYQNAVKTCLTIDYDNLTTDVYVTDIIENLEA